MPVRRLLFICLLSLGLPGASAASETLVVVNGVAIPQARLEYRLRLHPTQPADTPEVRARLRNELITEELLVQEAIRLGIDETLEESLDEQRDLRLVEAYIADELRARAQETVQMRAEFSRQIRARTRDSSGERRRIAGMAIQKGLDRSPEFRDEFDRWSRQHLVLALNSSYLREPQYAPTEAQLRSEYDRLKARNGDPGSIRYNARHILVDNEKLARAVRAKLKSGASFEALAAEASRDLATQDKGGELRWTDGRELGAPFADALRALQPGQLSAPVKSSRGWHIIRLEQAIRVEAFPPFSERRNLLETQYRAHLFENLIARLRAAARIQ